MGGKKTKPRRVLRFAVSGALLVGAAGLGACGHDEAGPQGLGNEPYDENQPTPNTPPSPTWEQDHEEEANGEERVAGEESSNEPAPTPDGDETTADEEAEAEAE